MRVLSWIIAAALIVPLAWHLKSAYGVPVELTLPICLGFEFLGFVQGTVFGARSERSQHVTGFIQGSVNNVRPTDARSA